MLKVIAEDFIKPEHVETVRPLYAELGAPDAAGALVPRL